MKSIITFLLMTLSLNLMAAPLATHGMVIFGKDRLMAYHLPMFHKIHNKQMVLTFEVLENEKQTIIKLQDSGFLTFVPEPFDLDKFIAAPFALKGDLYKGHFEKDGEIVLKGITLSNPEIIYLKELIAPNGKNEEYKLFGNFKDFYALHLIDGGTAKDQLVQLTTEFPVDIFSNELILKNQNLLEQGHDYPVSVLVPGRCPSRLCGSVQRANVLFKAQAIYFEDEVM